VIATALTCDTQANKVSHHGGKSGFPAQSFSLALSLSCGVMTPRTDEGSAMLTSYQNAKIAELTGLGWVQDGRQNLPGPGRAPMRYIFVFSNKLGMLAYVYPSTTEVIAHQAKPVDRLSLAFEALQ